jgi:hypothetical protein
MTTWPSDVVNGDIGKGDTGDPPYQIGRALAVYLIFKDLNYCFEV